MLNKKIFIYFFIALFIGAIGFFLIPAFAADGSGTATVSPSSVTAGSTNNSPLFTFTAAETMDSGEISLTTPQGWVIPHGSAGSPGYTTVTSAVGIIADVQNSMDSLGTWSATHGSGSMVLSADTTDKQEGTASLQNIIATAAATNDQWFYNNGAAENWGAANSTNGSRVGYWIKSSTARLAGDLSVQVDNTVGLSSPEQTVAVPALSADTWTYTSATMSTAQTAVLSYGFRYTNDFGAATIKTDSISSLFDPLDVVTNWSDTGANVTTSRLNTSGNYKEGTAAFRCTFAAGATVGDKCYRTSNAGGAFTIGPGTTVSLWVRSSVALNAGDFQWMDDGSATLGSPEDTVNLPALAANTWTYITLSAPNSANKLVRSYGFNQAVDKGALTIDFDALGKQVNASDSATGWNVPGAALTLSTDASVFHEGAGSLKNVITTAAVAGDIWFEPLGSAQDWSSYTTTGFWIRSTVNTSAGDIQFQYSSASDLSSPIATINVGALTANTWSYQKLTLSGTRSSVQSYGFKYATDIGAATINVDDVLLGPGSPTFSGDGTVSARFISLAAGNTVAITYGAGGGAQAITAPTSTQSAVFVMKSRISDSGSLVNIGSSPTISVVAGSTTELSLNNPGNGTAGTRTGYVVTRRDQYGNAVTSGAATYYLYSNSTGANKKFYNAASDGSVITSVSFADGNSTASFWYYDETVGDWTITVSDNATAPDGATGIVDATQAISITTGVVAHFFITDVTSIVAGTRGAYTVTRKDTFGNLVTEGSTTVYLYSSSTGANKKFYNAESGGSIITQISIGPGNSTANFWYYDEAAANWTVTVSDNASAPDGATGIIDAADEISVLAGATAQFQAVVGATMTAGTRQEITITRKDQFGNLVSTGAQTGYLYTDSLGSHKNFYNAATDGSAITSIIIQNGNSSVQAWYYDELAGNVTVTISDNATAPDNSTGIIDAVKPITILSGATSAFYLNDPGDMVTSTRTGYVITRKDEFGNPVVSGSQTAYLYSSSTGLNKSFYNAASGGSVITSIDFGVTSSTANFWYYDEAAGVFTITASDNASAPDGIVGIDDGTDSITVIDNRIIATKFVIADPTDAVVGQNRDVTIQAQDDLGRIANSFQQDVTLVASGSVTGEGLVNIVDGVGTITISDTVAETVNLTLLDSQSTGLNISSTQDIVFVPGDVASFHITSPGNIVAGTRAAYTVTRKDAYGNNVTAGSSEVYLYTDSANSLGKFYNAASGGSILTSIIIGVGNATADFWYYDETSGSWTISASDNAGAPDGATGIDDATDIMIVNPGTTARFMLSNPGDMNVETRVEYVVTRRDVFGNLVTSGSDTIYLFSDSTGARSVFYSAAVGGSEITSRTIPAGNSQVSFWYYDETAGTWNISASDNATAPDGAAGIIDGEDSIIVSTIPIVATRFVILDPSDARVGDTITVTVQAQDNAGNIDTTYQNDVTLAVSGAATGAGIVDIVNGVGSITISDAVGETVVLSLVDSSHTSLNISSSQSVIFTMLPTITVPSFGFGVYAVPNTLHIQGVAYPDAQIVLIERTRGVDEIVERVAAASDSGEFHIINSKFQNGKRIFVLDVKDPEQRSARTQLFHADFNSGTFETSNLFISPTIDVARTTIMRGDFVKVVGYAAPNTQVHIEIDNKFSYEVVSDDKGKYSMLINTSNLSSGIHSVRSIQGLDQMFGGFSLNKTFTVTTVTNPRADFNKDNRVDIRDSSLFLKLWKDGVKTADLNNDGKIDLSDFSVFLQAFKK